MSSSLPRRHVLVLGAWYAAANALRALAPPLARAAEPAPAALPRVSSAPAALPRVSSAPAALPRVSEEMLRIARREASPAGQRMQALVANDVFPSWTLNARQGESLRVTVENANDKEPTAVHFHGVLAPNAMDGVAGVTQPPIEPGASFVYELPVGEAGTFLYASTWRTQRQIGLGGALVVAERQPRHEVAHDEVILLADWTNDDPADVVRVLRGGRPQPKAVPAAPNPHAGHGGHGGHGGAEPAPGPNARAAHQAAMAALPSVAPAGSPAVPASAAHAGHDAHGGHAGHGAPAAAAPGTSADAHAAHGGHAGHDAPTAAATGAPPVPAGPHAAHILEAQKQAASGESPAQTYTGEPPRPLNPLPDGSPFPVDVKYNAYLLNGRSHREAWTKEVKTGERIRLRLVNAGSATFFRVQVEGHALTLIAADGRDVEPVEIDDLVIAPGERYDVLLTIAQPGSYTLRAAAVGASGGAVGVLHTADVRPVISTRTPKWGGRSLSYGQLRASADSSFGAGARERVRIVVDGDQARYLWTVDGTSFPGEFVGDAPASTEPLGLRAGVVTTLEVENRTALWQPLHLHGYRFRLLTGTGEQPRAPWKDTVAVGPGATVRLEIRTDAPGRWLLTATHLYRAQAGLARLLSVG